MNRAGPILLFLLLAATAFAADPCFVCQKPLTNPVCQLIDRVTGKREQVCGNCAAYPLCLACGIPAFTDRVALKDGRVLCLRDSKEAVLDGMEANQIFRAAQSDLLRMVYKAAQFPTNVIVELVDRPYMETLFKTPGYDSDCGNVLGVMSTELRDNKPWHQVKLLSGVGRSRMRIVAAHELAHCWFRENVSGRAPIARSTLEGFCELVGYKVARENEMQGEMAWIKLNNYTRGQVLLFIRADEEYGFYRVVEWMKRGKDEQLLDSDLDRIRVLNAAPVKESESRPSILPAAPEPAPDHLVIKGISGSGKNRMVLLNGEVLGPGQSARIKLADKTVLVKIIEVRAGSALVEVDGKSEELFLKSK